MKCCEKTFDFVCVDNIIDVTRQMGLQDECVGGCQGCVKFLACPIRLYRPGQKQNKEIVDKQASSRFNGHDCLENDCF